MRSVDGYSRCTRALATRRMAATRSATWSVSICSSGVPIRTRGRSRTSSRVTAPIPVTTMLRADIAGVKYRTRPSPTPTTTNSTVASSIFRPRTTPRATGLGSLTMAARGPPFGLAAGLLDRGGAGLDGAPLFAFPAGPPARPLEVGVVAGRLAVRRCGADRFGGSLGVRRIPQSSSEPAASSSVSPAVSSATIGAVVGSVTATPPGGRARCGWPAPAAR